MKILSFLGTVVSILISFCLLGQKQTAIDYHGNQPWAIYFKHIQISPDEFIENATLLVNNGKIEGVKAGKVQKEGYQFLDRSDAYAYPAFIDPISDYGISIQKIEKTSNPQYESLQEQEYYWNDAIRPHMSGVELFKPNEKDAKALRANGYGIVNTHHADGIARGNSAIVNLNKENYLASNSTNNFYSFDKGSSKMAYPSSLMGTFALMREYFNDIKWHKNNSNAPINLSLQRALDNQKNTSIYLAKDPLNLIRSIDQFQKFTPSMLLLADAEAYKVSKDLKQQNAKLIVEMNFPAPMQLESPLDINLLNLEEMKNWEMAMYNLALLEDEGIEFSLTHFGMEKGQNLLKNLRTSIKHGLNENMALAALTTVPAKQLGIANMVGKLEKGMMANFIITNEALFENSQILENWIDGEQLIFKPYINSSIEGKYKLQSANNSLEIELQLKNNKLHCKADSSSTAKIMASLNKDELSIRITGKEETPTIINLRKDGKNWVGKALVGLDYENYSLSYLGEVNKKEKQENTKEKKVPVVSFPNKAYGFKALPKTESFVIKNATVWTNTDQGILTETDVLISNGKVTRVGKNLSYPGMTTIDANGMHLTTGIIDEHSHIGISNGVNEGGQSVSAEVTIEDVVNPWDVNIYRQLAGGVTTSQLLHGSANPIGGRSAIVKLKYGANPKDMLFDGAAPFIKFALGENVKQSNWGDHNTKRFPQTRMGVEQLMEETFQRALAYREAKKAYNAASPFERKNLTSPKYNEELEVVLQVLDGKRFITCHSYVQSEINMLMKLADRYNFTVNTFTHILEGYKVADKMKEHGAGGSTFSDWWAYKFEVNDAIPYNAGLLHDAGVVTAINSDDAEMGRRLNQEAAKVVKYSDNVSEEEAWKMVTLNPAKLLHIDHKVGSIKTGKDADLVLWNTHPMSMKAKAEKTWIDGALWFDRSWLDQQETEIKTEKERIYKAMQQAIAKGAKPGKAKAKKQTIYHCMGAHH